jgi:hypothetical protein
MTIACFGSIASHAGELTPPEERMALIHQAGQRMTAAGFDQAGQVEQGDDWHYDLWRDTMVVSPLEAAWENNPARHRHAERDQFTTFAGHEHCHAYLWKHHTRLPAAVRQAQDACNVEPTYPFGRFFDELFCDVAPVAVFGKSAQQIMLDARDDPGFTAHFGNDRARLLRTAIAALPQDEPDHVTATAKAVATACNDPGHQAKRGVREHELATDIARDLAEFLHLPPGRISPPVIVPMRNWPVDERTRFETWSFGHGERPLLALMGAYETCLRAVDTPQRHDARRAREKCQLTASAYDQAFCSGLSVSIAKSASRGLERELTAMRFGPHSLPAKTLTELSSYMLGATPEEYSWAIESACGATVPELADWERLSQ